MKPFSALLSTLAVYLLVSANVFAASRDGKDPDGRVSLGPGSGGGGGVIICRKHKDRSIVSVDLVDLKEAAFYDRVEFSSRLALLPWREQVKNVMNRIAFVDPEFHSMLWKRLQMVNNQLEEGLRSTRGTTRVFAQPQDLSHGRLPPLDESEDVTCEIRGAAVYNDGNDGGIQLFLSEFIWNNLSEMNKAALVMHEAVYRTHRDVFTNLYRNDAPDSSATRKLVGFLFSKELEENSLTAQEREKFANGIAYRGYFLAAKAEDIEGAFRKKVQAVMKPLLPYFLKGVERALYLGSRTCGGNAFLLRVQDKAGQDSLSGCELKAIAHQYPAKVDVRELAPFQKIGRNGGLYKYTPHSAGLLEDVSLSCSSKDSLKRANPGFSISCGEERIAEVKSSEVSEATALSIRMKSDYGGTFLKDFEF